MSKKRLSVLRNRGLQHERLLLPKRKRDEERIEVETSTPGSPVLSVPRRSNRTSSSAQTVHVEDSDEDVPAARKDDEYDDDYDTSNDP